jgi:hypothetical protein
MATTMVAQMTQTSKASRAYFAHLDDEHGILTQDAAGQIWFRNSLTDALTAITPAQCNYLSVHGEVGLAEAAALATARQGGRRTWCAAERRR